MLSSNRVLPRMLGSGWLETIDCSLAYTLFCNGMGSVIASTYPVSYLGWRSAGLVLTSALYNDHLSSVESWDVPKNDIIFFVL